MLTKLMPAALAALLSVPLPGQSFARRYSASDSLSYHMEGLHVEGLDTTRYQADASGIEARDSAGRYVERLTWTHVMRNGLSSVPAPSRAAEDLTRSPE